MGVCTGAAWIRTRTMERSMDICVGEQTCTWMNGWVHGQTGTRMGVCIDKQMDAQMHGRGGLSHREFWLVPKQGTTCPRHLNYPLSLENPLCHFLSPSDLSSNVPSSARPSVTTLAGMALSRLSSRRHSHIISFLCFQSVPLIRWFGSQGQGPRSSFLNFQHSAECPVHRRDPVPLK